MTAPTAWVFDCPPDSGAIVVLYRTINSRDDRWERALEALGISFCIRFMEQSTPSLTGIEILDLCSGEVLKEASFEEISGLASQAVSR